MMSTHLPAVSHPVLSQCLKENYVPKLTKVRISAQTQKVDLTCGAHVYLWSWVSRQAKTVLGLITMLVYIVSLNKKRF